MFLHSEAHTRRGGRTAGRAAGTGMHGLEASGDPEDRRVVAELARLRLESDARASSRDGVPPPGEAVAPAGPLEYVENMAMVLAMWHDTNEDGDDVLSTEELERLYVRLGLDTVVRRRRPCHIMAAQHSEYRDYGSSAAEP